MQYKARGSGVVLGTLFAAVALVATVAMAESPSALLEKAIYTEETVGDLDAAAKLYEKAVVEAKTVEAVAAKAQYRLGLCLLKQGKKAQGIAALAAVAKRFPGQKEIVAAAQKHLPAQDGLKLQPAPWADGETLHYRLELGGGLELGTIIYSVASAQRDGHKIWRFRSRVFAAGRQTFSRVDAKFGSLEPLDSTFRILGMSQITSQYALDKIAVTTKTAGKETTRTVTTGKVFYDNEQGVYVFRCLPMAEKYQTKVPIFAEMGSGLIDIGVEVQGTETVEVPAGKFTCFKVFLPAPINQTFWLLLTSTATS